MKLVLRTLTAVILVVACYSCSGVDKLNFARELQSAISKTYNTKDIQIKVVNHDKLLISLQDSDFGAQSSQEKQKISREIGKMANDLRKDEPFKSGTVNFIEETNLLVYHSTTTVSYNMFK